MAKSKVIEGLEDALRSARCKHVLVVKERHPGGLPKVKFCRRCEATFHIPSSRQLVDDLHNSTPKR